MTDGTPNPTRRSLAPLWAMALIFALPVVAAWFFYFNPEYLPSGRSNRGELINPPVAIPPAALRTPEGDPFDGERLAGRWTLVVPSRPPCAAPCLDKLAEIRQIRLALGESRLSVERLLLFTSATGANPALGEDLAGTLVASLGSEAAAQLLPQLGKEEALWDRVLILDPQGRLMMRYAPAAPPKDVLKDLERLLKASKNWIKGAQSGHQ